ncbi:methyltransferase family protein [Youngiibacter multivorans]|uniref:Protein-S-isoprenylcysteine O-methyltransferase Ste14 n=1 Tax=Youngiibacter multivorans TaxID=937251 RepID=A0ABS4G7L3_9CLOT|nr:isoprenylcysteine carboxylmethyltransferase family protein [Youngiibacter multivorans]MBP1920255.1 protein-S-isoprenylcysteine O-methyltransferase Ste14 [Youngiibacter multivorans]
MSITFENIMTMAISSSVTMLFAAIVMDFMLFEKKGGVKKEKRSIVATGTMTLFYLVYFIVIWTRIGAIDVQGTTAVRALRMTGTILVALGSAMNILGRISLKGNWADHVRIYKDQTLVETGLYGIVRHPLYSSLMVMMYGGSLAYLNWASALLTTFVFIPFMYYRAKQEEIFLMQEFERYANYSKRVGMFFPKFWR